MAMIAAVTVVTVLISGCAPARKWGSDNPNLKNSESGGNGRLQWVVRDGGQAIARALELSGISAAASHAAEAHVVMMDEDKTPFLHGQVTNRPIWRVTISNYRIRLPSALPGDADRYERTFDILLDPRNGGLLRISSRWPVSAPPESAPEPRAAFAEQCFRDSGNERYHSFPDAPPKVSFLDALEVIYLDGVGNPLIASQILAHHIMRSSMGRKPQQVWAVTLRGVPPIRTAYPGVPIAARDHMRYIVDANTGKWLFMTTCPQPEEPTTQAAEGKNMGIQPDGEAERPPR
jgi:hypothetical protein